MRRFLIAAALAASAPVVVLAQAPAAAGVTVTQGKMLYTSNGQRLGAVYRINNAGDPQIIINGKLVTIPTSTLSDVGGKLTTSLERKDIGRAK